ncbi:phenylalanine--tRNA ligase subunit alpha [Helicobacter hepaticus]|jgi:phenylalanyl-tRNA synthetase alpha chain|uniref:Phenylalanine--tRNA ligase alpha subunit n=1 Tax=Helicobacter hepaticus (strain ATCC 51449 / 3B1) TaxID=235279 RepID=SYFA_HELHP|nr:phenylalanine--tRNA ligase subunit alpha [Helicobacter hepaticus]Q7VK64.2 RecName: Full=Phenylalanine--tRNA ligase alpha subunit; AltName: Full=Phenylalanyl-tRNA synthetase alpha subunit; Short=PheRS [Helicobacter hepaticus ATCC 51449]
MQEIMAKLEQLENLNDLERLRVEVMGKKGILTQQFALLKNLEGETKKTFAKELNKNKENFEKMLESKRESLLKVQMNENLTKEVVDASLFTALRPKSNGHPIYQTMDRIIDFFVNMNFAIQTGPLVEDDFHNFEALNLPVFHPARDMQDTFYFKDSMLLRTHTSPVQIRTMQSQHIPIRMIAPGSVFRRDYDLTHSPMFHQVEGLVVDEKDKISFVHLKYILEDFLHYMFGDVRIRFRSSFFPFTEPSAEVDISCVFCGGSGCRVCSHTGWLEVLGCGIVNQKVFDAVGHKNVSGYAFGLGVERFAMLLHRVNDLRSFFETDLRVLEQF